MKTIRKIAGLIRDFTEKFVPSATFVIMFLAFVYCIGARYLFREPSPEGMELQTVMFLATVLFGIALGSRYEDHVVFDLVYNKMHPAVQTVCRILGYLLISVFTAWMIPDSIVYLKKLTVPTPLLKIPKWLLFAPFVLMLAQACVLYLVRAIKDIKALVNKTYTQTYNVEDKEQLI